MWLLSWKAIGDLHSEQQSDYGNFSFFRHPPWSYRQIVNYPQTKQCKAQKFTANTLYVEVQLCWRIWQMPSNRSATVASRLPKEGPEVMPASNSRTMIWTSLCQYRAGDRGYYCDYLKKTTTALLQCNLCLDLSMITEAGPWSSILIWSHWKAFFYPLPLVYYSFKYLIRYFSTVAIHFLFA